MRFRFSVSFFAALLVCALTSSVSAQQDSTRFERLWLADYDGPRRLEVGVSAGYALSSDWTDLIALHVFDPRGGIHRQVLLRNVAVAPGAGGAVAVTYWRGRHGFRATAGYSKSCLTTSSRCVNGDLPPENGAALGVAEVSMDVFRYGVEGIVGLRNWRDSQFWRPYLIVGAGGVTYDPDEDELPLFPGTFETLVPPPASGPGVVITNGATTLLVATDELGLENVFGLTLGVGMDFRIPLDIGGVALRLEAADQITSSPFSVTVSRLDADDCCFFERNRDRTVFRSAAIHNLRFTAGVALELPLRGPRTETDPWDRTRVR
jgi:hypothetical protein